VTRIVSGAVLILLVVGLVWFAPPVGLLGAAVVVAMIGAQECTHLARARGTIVSAPATMALTGLTAVAVAAGAAGLPPVDLSVVLMAGVVAVGALTLGRWRGDEQAMAGVAVSVFPALYLGLPLGALVAIHAERGPGAVFLLMLTVIVSDTAQYYTGRAFGRRRLAPAVSPGKTIEGAIGGFVCGIAMLVAGAEWWLPDTPIWLRVAAGIAVVTLGIAGDLFESMLKRSAGVKDSSSLIPGHGGVLDRIDALLFAAPAYYMLIARS
jgi:phosphatidate cytidylyltransferase